jgi:opacity protein-like surface antigen
MRRWTLAIACSLILGLAAVPSQAQNLGFRGWGLRAGLSSDPDQGVVGVQFNLGEFAPQLRFQPSIEAGFGDHRDLLQVTIPVLYRFDVKGNFTPYAGGGLGVAWIDYGNRAARRYRNTSDVVLSPVGIGGIEWPLKAGNDVFLELNVAGDKLPSAKVVVGWVLRR